MAFTGLFAVSQTSDITSLVITDNSSYSSEAQGSFSGRRVYLYRVDTQTLVPDGTVTTYVDFPFSFGASITISGVLLRDYSLSINVVWLSNAPQSGSVYTAIEVTTFLNYTKQFLYEKVQDMAAQPNIVNNTNFYNSLRIVQSEVENAEISTVYGDQFNAQSSIDRAYQLINNESFYF
jgi:hypothetical protein